MSMQPATASPGAQTLADEIAEDIELRKSGSTCPICTLIVYTAGERWPYWIGEKPAHLFCFNAASADE